MSKARLVITAVVLEKRPAAQVAAEYGVSRSWVYELVARYRAEGDAAFEPRSRRPRSTPNATTEATIELILQLRDRLATAGLDAGADTIGWHLARQHRITVSRATVHRILTRHGKVNPQPQKRPRSSYTMFQADQPNECWQSDFTHYRLTCPDGSPGADVEIITWLDDHSRYALHVSAHPRVTATIVRDTFRASCAEHGTPYSTLTDNGMVYTVRLASHRVRGGRNALETELAALGVIQKNSRPNHPTTCGKVERFQQTLKNWLRAQPDQPTTIAQRCRPCSTGSPSSTTPSAPTAPSRTAPPRPPRTPPDPKPPRANTQANPQAAPTTAAARTGSARPATSPCAMTAACTTSASGAPTPGPPSCCRSRTSTSASPTPSPANSCASSPSTPPRTTSPNTPNSNSRTYIP
ncbi:transposase [Humibacillus xanthopallidus]|uniref:Transposase n=1 Tax=Humibacillus xanthopallidus TaxID=412689 RepID=A0A543HIA0_9MICO|nr:DDE-type integrase/transposase/recombinase [Humibacillus xanthopallidus]TQM58056.1 transposase [Humibacillus xanthopallidus]